MSHYGSVCVCGGGGGVTIWDNMVFQKMCSNRWTKQMVNIVSKTMLNMKKNSRLSHTESQ